MLHTSSFPDTPPSLPDTPVPTVRNTIEVLSPNKAWLAVARPNRHAVDIYKADGETWRYWVSYYGHWEGVANRQGTILAVTWLPDSKYLFSASSTGFIHLWNRSGIHERTLIPAVNKEVKALHWHDSYGLQIHYMDEVEKMATSGWRHLLCQMVNRFIWWVRRISRCR